MPVNEADLHFIGVDENSERTPGHVRSVDRAVSILEFLARNGWSGVTDVGYALGVHKSTAFRLLSTLEARGLVEQHIDSGKYRLGYRLVHLAHSVAVGPDIRQQAKAACEWLAEQTDETITVSVLEDLESVTIDQIMSPSTVASRSWLGRRTPLHCTAPGKVFLASLSAKDLREVLAGPHERHTEHTIVAPNELRKEVERAAAAGFAVAIEELEEGLCAASSPIIAADGSVAAAICISGPSQRLDRDRLLDLAPVVKRAAARASFAPRQHLE